MTKKEEARKFLEALEKDPKHTINTEQTKKQTKDDDINDPKNHKKDGEMDTKWHQDKNGFWTHPDFEGGE